MTDQRVAIVTGGARGIGAAIARRFAQDGIAVAVFDLVESDCQAVVDEITSAGGRAIGVGVDVSQPEAVNAGVQRVADELGPPVVLVNNAGVIRDNVMSRMTIDDWDTVIAVHLRGAFNMVKACQPHMKAEQWGRVINMSSTSALGNVGQANYATVKAGLQGFTKTLALEFGRINATANAIAPGFVATDMTRATAARMNLEFEDFLAEMAKPIPLGRVAYPDDIAAVASFLAREDAGYVSGQVIYVAGGPKA